MRPIKTFTCEECGAPADEVVSLYTRKHFCGRVCLEIGRRQHSPIVIKGEKK